MGNASLILGLLMAGGRLLASSILSGAPVVVSPAVSPAPAAVNQFAGWPIQTGVGASGPGVPRVALSGDSALAPNQSLNVNEKAGLPLSLVSAVNLTAAIAPASGLAEKGPRWSVVSQPAVSVQATATRAAGGPATRHVADCISVDAGSVVGPGAATQVAVNLRDGASGAGTILATFVVVLAVLIGNVFIRSLCDLRLIGSPGTAMTLEWSAAVGNEFESVSLSGFDVQ
jgi:hypothetical protein